jgi:hypothetical protein
MGKPADAIEAASAYVLQSAPTLNNVETATVVIAAAAVILTAVAVAIAALAIVGYVAVRRRAGKLGAEAGSRAAARDLRTYLDGPEFKEMVRMAVAAQALGEIQGDVRDNGAPANHEPQPKEPMRD